ncbi:MAG: bifunctional 5,10-methylene-tetrahydrofolate dehydrogenase/5,10-methylene-tetrahydrofolate cyclohydrolase [Spirochaetales bacterium]|nr:bifunctional 5,10-methylene-tetrahydrofolate dehydrogenase/5,10-methylene-tetrahydrofolate cyclohydrolase [Spirochaetales bacterium]
MSAREMSGIPIAEKILDEVEKKARLLASEGIVPGLGTILVGNNPNCRHYVDNKHKTCKTVGIKSFNIDVPESATQEALINAVEEFNNNPAVDAFLIQSPVPEKFNFTEAVSMIKPEKDADGLHPYNLGKLVLQEDGPLPCTPAGIMEMLRFYEIPVQGRHVVIVGRGPTLGRPLALMLSMKREYANAAVTMLHSGVKNIKDYTVLADIIVCGVGIPGFIRPDMVKRGCVAISGGITWEGKRLIPDIDVAVGDVAGWITSRLGGVGPTTIAMLLKNTIIAAGKRLDGIRTGSRD